MEAVTVQSLSVLAVPQVSLRPHGEERLTAVSDYAVRTDHPKVEKKTMVVKHQVSSTILTIVMDTCNGHAWGQNTGPEQDRGRLTP